ncbi:unnamed protein product [Triticum turgidum subsp. durum]|uniref:Uncharacterized protein n=1 Tax=Triticum turgidum subsp. durum TaxID=4567 RepID=A0A9R0ZFR2_TRITD|nr:unnamed protein product [Triticum turgidum subsp. durum]
MASQAIEEHRSGAEVHTELCEARAREFLVELGRMHSMTGVKSKELLIWVTISEIVISPSGSKIVFRTPAGLGRAFPVSAFQLNPPAPEAEAKAAEEAAAN